MNPRFEYKKYPTIRKVDSFHEFISQEYSLENLCIVDIDFTDINFDINWDALQIGNTTFLGCTFDESSLQKLYIKGAMIFPKKSTLPYNPYRTSMYDFKELNRLNNGESVDLAIYNHFSCYRHTNSMEENLWQRIHDHAIDTNLNEYITTGANGHKEKKIVGIMGGHSVARNSREFLDCALLCQKLTKAGYFIVTGGGPGIMEAANMGAYFGAYSLEELMKGIQFLSKAPKYSDKHFSELAIELREKFSKGYESLAIPTWFYGHEPSNVFSSHIAKYFSNSIREDTLLAISLHGVIFCPGSAGTIQEIFADAAQNHYSTYKWISPMIFYGTEHYSEKLPVKPLILALSSDKKYANSIYFSDENDDIIAFLKSNPPKL